MHLGQVVDSDIVVVAAGVFVADDTEVSVERFSFCRSDSRSIPSDSHFSRHDS